MKATMSPPSTCSFINKRRAKQRILIKIPAKIKESNHSSMNNSNVRGSIQSLPTSWQHHHYTKLVLASNIIGLAVGALVEKPIVLMIWKGYKKR